MRRVLFLTFILTLSLNSGCGGSSPGNPEIMPKWPPDRPVMIQPPEVDQGNIRKYRFLLHQPEWSDWGGFHPDKRNEVWGSLSAIYFQAKLAKDHNEMSSAIWAMGATGIVEFLPTILEAVDTFEDRSRPTAVYAINGMPSDYAVYTLLQYINDEEFHIRNAAVYALGTFKYYDIFPGARNFALNGLLKRLSIEENMQIRGNIEDALDKLLEDINRTQP